MTIDDLCEDLDALGIGGPAWIPESCVEACRPLVEAGIKSGRIKRIEREDGVFVAPAIVSADEPTCRVCGCSEYRPCEDDRGACWWVEADLCSHCKAKLVAVERICGQ